MLHASTLLTRSPVAVLAHLQSLRRYADQLLVFAISPPADAQDLSKLVKELTSFSPENIGCITASLPGSENTSLVTCSLAVFDRSNTVPFRSTIPGIAEPQVGRWHAFREKGESDTARQRSLKDLFVDGIWRADTVGYPLPRPLHTINPHEINECVFFSDKSPEGLLRSLGALTDTTKLGLFASSTPFVTGRPVTLFRNSEIHDSGAVGFATRLGPNYARTSVEFKGFVPLSDAMIVTDREGNMINSLNNANPTQLLLAAIRKHGIDMDGSQFFKDNEVFSLGTVRSGNLCQMYNITAGDPSRGNISLGSDEAPHIGSQVQFFHRPKSVPSQAPSLIVSPHSRALTFMSSIERLDDGRNQPALKNDERVIDDHFLASSENGFVLSRPDEERESSWTCAIPGGSATLEYRQ